MYWDYETISSIFSRKFKSQMLCAWSRTTNNMHKKCVTLRKTKYITFCRACRTTVVVHVKTVGFFMFRILYNQRLTQTLIHVDIRLNLWKLILVSLCERQKPAPVPPKAWQITHLSRLAVLSTLTPHKTQRCTLECTTPVSISTK